MGILGRFLSKKKKVDQSLASEPDILFGKYTDRNKTKEQYESWDKAVNLFNEKKYLSSYYEFFTYLKDNKTENVEFEKDAGRIKFSFFQGSKIVHGSLNEREVQAEAEVARFQEQNMAVMRKLLKENYYLYFSKFAVKNDVYTIKYYSPIEDAQPSSFYYALKEMATEADMWDDVLVEEFPQVDAINIEHIEELNENEKRVKLTYFRKWINETLTKVNELDSGKFTGAIAYYLLNLTFKIHHLLSPEGTLLDDIRFIQSLFYKEDNKNLNEKEAAMIEVYKRLLTKTDEEIVKSFYKVRATFAVVGPTNHDTVAGFMNTELGKTKSYIENKYIDIVEEICKYTVYFASYSYGMPAVANEIIMVFWRIFNPDFFNDLGFKQSFFNDKTNTIDQENVLNRINHILSHSKKRHPMLQFDVNKLDFSSKLDFAVSFIGQFQHLKYD